MFEKLRRLGRLFSVFGKGLVALLVCMCAELCFGEEIDVTTLPSSNRLFLFAAEVEVQPAKAELILPKASGLCQVLVANGQILEKDELWALFDPEKLELERQLLANEESSLPEKLANLELGYEESVAQARANLAEVSAEFKQLSAVSLNGEVREDPEFAQSVEEALKGLEEKLGRSRKRLEILEEGLGHAAEKKELQLTWERKKAAFEELVRNSEERAGFRGEIRFLNELADDLDGIVPREVRISGSEAIALIQAEDRFEVRLPPVALNYAGVNPTRTFVVIGGGDGVGDVQAIFREFEMNERRTNAAESLIFEVRSEDIDEVRQRKTGKKALGSVFADLGEPARIVPKTKLVDLLSGEEQIGSWRETVRRLMPGYVFVAEGRGALAVRKEEE